MNSFGNFLITKDHNLAIYTRGSNKLYINKDYIDDIDKESPLYKLIESGYLIKEDDEAFVNNRDNILLSDIDGNAKLFVTYKFFRLLRDDRKTDSDDDELNENDCLNFSEFLTCRNKSIDKHDSRISILPFHYDASVLKAKHIDKRGDFGVSYKRNVDIVNKIGSSLINDNANPDQGNSYAIVKNEIPEEGQTPYHIAFVVYKHNGINVTLEASAHDNLDGKQKQYNAFFSFYDSNPKSRNTFHKYYKKRYQPMPMTTIVLESRDSKLITKDIMKEIKPVVKTTKRKATAKKRTTRKKTAKKINY